MIVKTKLLTYRQIDYVIACLIKLEMEPSEFMGHLAGMRFWCLEKTKYSSDITLAWPIIAENKISLSDWASPSWRTGFSIPQWHPDEKLNPSHHSFDDRDPIVAAMKTFISSKLGKEIELPEGLRYVE